uniref:HAT C-terminal dimerisation domain-containing protein n=1 Tax=Octopus bimaculoides TaxID=37653 RepID=A0A0L8HJX3_OCTBM
MFCDSRNELYLLFLYLILKHFKTFWLEVLEYKDATGGNPFRDIADFAINLLTLPNSNAEVEQLFSSMGVMKSKLKNKMHLPMLSIKYGQKRCGKCCKNT